ncbi:Uncharacterised protein [Vibrio cholerae]|nr:Uncharacterised protein [Vibrio cholerae]
MDFNIFTMAVLFDRLTRHLCWYATHHVVTGWDNRNRFFHWVHVSKGT